MMPSNQTIKRLMMNETMMHHIAAADAMPSSEHQTTMVFIASIYNQ